MTYRDNSTRKLEGVKQLLSDLQLSLKKDLADAEKSIKQTDFERLRPYESFDSSEFSRDDPRHYLHPLSKWPRIKHAPLSCNMQDLLTRIAYPHQPEVTEVAIKNAGYSILLRWQTSQLIMRQDETAPKSSKASKPNLESEEDSSSSLEDFDTAGFTKTQAERKQ